MTVESLIRGVIENFGFIAVVVGVTVAVARAAAGRPFFAELLRWAVFFGVGVNCTDEAGDGRLEAGGDGKGARG
jgi:hypothetical protein